MKSIPLYIVIATIVLPIFFSSRPVPKKQLRNVQILWVAVALMWAYLCLVVYPANVQDE
jgi:hypothetical protein